MAITNGYATLDEMKLELGLPVSNTTHDDNLELAVNAASRQIDGYCGRRFWQDGTVGTREYWADSYTYCCVPEGISTTTGLVVKIDQDGDGTYETTLTLSTDFILTPPNALDNTPAWPYTEILLVNNYTFPLLYNGRPGVQVTAKFGFPAVPDDVSKACRLLAHDAFKGKDAAFGVAGINDTGLLRVSGMRADARALLAPYKRPSVG